MPEGVSPADEPSALTDPGSAPLYAALDLGTNSCRMLIAQPMGSQFVIVDSFSKTVQLGVGLEATGRLSRASMQRTIQALRICEKKIEAAQACCGCVWSRPKPAAAPAMPGTFIRQVRRETGLTLDIIAPEEEARFAVISCAPLVSPSTEQLAGRRYRRWIDRAGLDRPVGGAVRKPAEGDHAAAYVGFNAQGEGAHARVVDWISVPLGVATLKDQFTDVDDDAARFALMSWFFEEHLASSAPTTPRTRAKGSRSSALRAR